MTFDRRRYEFLLATWEGGGSVTPAMEVARKLVLGGHRVRVMSDRCNRGEAEAVGAMFIPWTRAPSRPDRSRESELLRDWEPADPQDGLRQSIETVFVGPALAYAKDVIEELERRPADLVVASELLFGVAAGCLARRQPHALLSVNISLYPLPGVPPLGPGLPPARTDGERALHADIAAGNVALFDHGLPALNAARAALGLGPLAHVVDQVRAADRLLLATSPAFDFAPPALPGHVRYVGPQVGEPAWAQPWRSPWPENDPRPLALVGFSTTFQNHVGVLQRVLDAAAELPMRLLVTHGDAVYADELTPPTNARLVHSAPHDAVMREAALVVTHGGHGTVIKALTNRLPMLLIPHGRDQNDNAVRITERGAGLSLATDADAVQIRAALQRLIAEPAFAEAASRLGEQVAADVRNSPVVAELEALARRARARAEPLCA